MAINHLIKIKKIKFDLVKFRSIFMNKNLIHNLNLLNFLEMSQGKKGGNKFKRDIISED